MRKRNKLLYILSILLPLSACSSNSNASNAFSNNMSSSSHTNNSSSTASNEFIDLNKEVFRDYKINLDDVTTLGIADSKPNKTDTQSSKNDDKNYFIKMKKNGMVEEVIFESDDNEEVEQSQINGEIDKLYIAQNFIYFSFSTNISQTARFNSPNYDKFYYNDESNVSFIIAKSTGKIYSTDEFNSYEVIDDNIIKVSYKNFIHLTLDGDNLIATDLMPNKNIMVYYAVEDMFGNVYIYNASKEETPEVPGNYHYTKRSVQKGSDGYVYVVGGGLAFGGTILISSYDEDGNVIYPTNRTAKIVQRTYPLPFPYWSTFILTGTKILQIDPNSGGPSTKIYTGATGRGVPKKYINWGTLFGYNQCYVINDYFIVGTTMDGTIEYFDARTLNEPTLSPLTNEFTNFPSYSKTGNILAGATLGSYGSMVLAVIEEITGTSIYYITEENGNIIPVLLANADYNYNIITIQPLIEFDALV